MTSLLRYFFALATTYAMGYIGFMFMRSGFDTWYEMVPKPPLAPSSNVFFLTWFIAYTLVGLALGVLWSHTSIWHPWVGNLFVALAFNTVWALFLFNLHVILIALVDLLLLLLICISLILAALEMEKRAGYMLLPYLAWLLFLLYVNAGMWLLS